MVANERTGSKLSTGELNMFINNLDISSFPETKLNIFKLWQTNKPEYEVDDIWVNDYVVIDDLLFTVWDETYDDTNPSYKLIAYPTTSYLYFETEEDAEAAVAPFRKNEIVEEIQILEAHIAEDMERLADLKGKLND